MWRIHPTAKAVEWAFYAVCRKDYFFKGLVMSTLSSIL